MAINRCPIKRVSVIAGLLSLVWLLPFHVSVAQDDEFDEARFNEYQVKALFLYNFANFVEWPEDAFSNEITPIRLCLYGQVPFGVFLDEVSGTLIGDRPLQVDRTDILTDIEDGCHILFVGEDKARDLATLWQALNFSYILSVGENSGFVDNGGIIHILRTSDQVAFDINISNAINNGLFISSDLLSLAREIKKNTSQASE